MDEALRRIRRQYLSTLDYYDAASYIAALERALGIAAPYMNMKFKYSNSQH